MPNRYDNQCKDGFSCEKIIISNKTRISLIDSPIKKNKSFVAAVIYALLTINSLKANIPFGISSVKKPKEKSTAFSILEKIAIEIKKNINEKICRKKNLLINL